jgi:nucleoside-diphosphate-sugar epimerase
MDVFVIGGTGFIGKKLVESIVESDQVMSLRLLSRGNNSFNFDHLKKVEIVCGDVFDKCL